MALRLVLDTNVLVGGSFRPASASGGLVRAVREGRLVGVWCAATRAEAERLFRQIPPLRTVDVAVLFPEAGRCGLRIDPGTFPAVAGALDRTFAALAATADVPLVTSDGALARGARSGGVPVLSPAAALARVS